MAFDAYVEGGGKLLVSSPEPYLRVAARTEWLVKGSFDEEFVVTAIADSSNLTRNATERTFYRAFDLTRESVLLAVSDGGWSPSAFDKKARCIVDSVVEFLAKSDSSVPAAERLRGAFEYAHRRLVSAVENLRVDDELRTRLFASLTAALIERNEVTVAQVGTTRAYLSRSDKTRLILFDDKLGNYLLRHELADYEEVFSQGLNSVVMQALGVPNLDIVVGLARLALKPDDRLILSTDLLGEKILDDELGKVVRRPNAITSTCDQLFELVKSQGWEDNLTVVTAEFVDDSTLSSALPVESEDGVDVLVDQVAEVTIRHQQG